MRSILISGASGYFGSFACRYFAAQGDRILKATRQADADFHFDLDAPEKFAEQKSPQPIEVFIHAAAAHEVTCAREPFRSMSQNVAGTLAALEFCVRNKIPRFVYLSTFRVYGRPVGRIDETVAPQPVDIYGLSHLQAEQCVEMFARNGKLDGMVVRPTNFFGVPADLRAFNRWTLTAVAFVRDALTKGTIELKTPGLQKRNFVSLSRVCELIDRNLKREKPWPLLHAAGRETLSIRDWARLVAEVFRRELHKEVTVIAPDGDNSEPEYQFVSCRDVMEPQAEPSLASFIKEFHQMLAASPGVQ